MALSVRLTEEEESRQAQTEPSSLEAYDAFLRGVAHYYLYSRHDLAKAARYFEKAIALDPNYSRAHSWLAAVYWESVSNDWSRSLGISVDDATTKVKQHLAEALKDPDPRAHFVVSKMHSNEGRYDEAIAAARRMIALNPNDGLGYLALARAAVKAGRAAEALAAARMAIRLDPRGDDRGTYSYRIGDAQFHMDRYEEAVESFLKVVNRNPAAEWTYLLLAANYGHLGREREARSALETFDAKRAKVGKSAYTIARIEGWALKEQSYKNRFKEGLRKAGMSEGTSTSAEPEFSASLLPATVEGATTIDAVTAKLLFDRGVPFVDVRDPDEWNAGRVPGAVHLELNREFTEARLSEVAAKDDEVVIYAITTWSTSARACMRAASWGFEKVYYFRPGFSGWQAAGHPVEMPSG